MSTKRNYGCAFVNLLAFLLVLASVISCLLALAVFIKPDLPLNPFQPPTPLSFPTLPSVTPTTSTSLFPTFPATFTPSPAATRTQAPSSTASATLADFTPTENLTQSAQLTESLPTDTPQPSNTPTITNTPEPTNTSAPTFTPTQTRSAFPFTVQGGAPVPNQNFANSAGCNWMGVGGQAIDLSGNPIPNLIVHLEGGGLSMDTFTGTKTAYGLGGYEFFLNNRPVQTTGEYVVQLLDQTGATALSEKVIVNTFADCSKNLLLVNFVQNH